MLPAFVALVVLGSGASALAGAREDIEAAVHATPELDWISERSTALGVRTALAGGTALRWAHHVLSSTRMHRPPSTDLSHIFRATEDLTLTVSGPPAAVQRFKDELRAKIPYPGGAIEKPTWAAVVGERTPRYASWRFDTPKAAEPSLVVDDDLRVQLGGPAITPGADERALALLDDGATHIDLNRLAADPGARFRQIVALVKHAALYDLQLDPANVAALKWTVDGLRGHLVPSGRLFRAVNEVFEASTQLEHTYALIEALGLPDAMKTVTGPLTKRETEACPRECYEASRWLFVRKPLPSFPVGTGDGKTAAELGISEIAHATTGLRTFEALHADPARRPNALSAVEGWGQTARFGPGLYAMKGRTGRAGDLHHMYTLRGRLSPHARLGTDFEVHEYGSYGQFPTILNREAVTLDEQPRAWSLRELFEHVQHLGTSPEMHSPVDGLEIDEAAQYDLTMRTINRRINFLDPAEVAEVEALVERKLSGHGAQPNGPILEMYFSLALSTKRPDLALALVRDPHRHLGPGTAHVLQRAWWKNRPELLDAFLESDADRADYVHLAVLPRYAKRYDLLERMFGAARNRFEHGPIASDVHLLPHWQRNPVIHELTRGDPTSLDAIREGLRADPGAMAAQERARDKAAARRRARLGSDSAPLRIAR